jgi:hypothetical protein
MTRVLLATSNGTGMGHLTRQAAVGLSMAGHIEPTLFSLSIGLPQAMSLGLEGEYVPSYDRPWIEGRAWNDYLRDRLTAIIEETDSKAVLFDGVAAYPGIGLASSLRRDIGFLWLRRGMWRRGTSKTQLRRRWYFDRVIEPGDLAGDADRGPTASEPKVTRVSPVSLIEVLDPLPRDEARLALDLPMDGEVALLTLGSGRLGDVSGPGQVAIEALLEKRDVHVAVTRSAVAMNEVLAAASDRVTVIRDVYPLLPYLPAFDMAVSSAGYNAVHELIPSGIPTLLVANTSTRTDDQEARSRRLAELGLALSATDVDPESVGSGAARLLDRPLREELSARASATRSQMRGASEIAALTLDFVTGFTLRKKSLSEVRAERAQMVRDAVKDALGEDRVESLKRRLGRNPPAGRRTRVHISDGPDCRDPSTLPVVVTSQLDRALLAMQNPLEHVLVGSSGSYRERRLELIHTYYDVAQ